VVTSQAAGQQPAPQRGLLVIYSALMLALLLAALDQTIVATALPTIVSDLGGLSHLSWVITAYLLASTATTQVWGKLGDQYGRKYLFITAIVIFLIGSALSGLSQTMGELIAFRALQGSAAAASSCSPRPSWVTSSRLASGASTRARSALSLAYQASSAPCSAGSSWTTCPGGGCSTSTCRSGPPRSP
jgi:MFS family permease